MAVNSVTQAAISTTNSPSPNQFLRWDGTDMNWAVATSGSGSVEVDFLTIDLNPYGSIEVKNGGITGNKLSSSIGFSTSGTITAAAISATNLYGNGSNLSGVNATTASYSTLSGNASSAASSGYATQSGSATQASYSTQSGTAT